MPQRMTAAPELVHPTAFDVLNRLRSQQPAYTARELQIVLAHFVAEQPAKVAQLLDDLEDGRMPLLSAADLFANS